jgi:SPP1 gp7 family putative phage head morphogenesis protein
MKTTSFFGDKPRTPDEKAAMEMFSEFAKSVPTMDAADIEFTRTHDGFRIDMTVWSDSDKDPLSLLDVSRSFTPGIKTIELDLFEMEESLQGKGLAKKLHSLQLKFMKKFKYQKYVLAANLDVGGYAWLKYGMGPDRPEKLLYIVNQYKETIRQGTPEYAFWKKEYQALNDAPDRLKYVRQNLAKLKPAFLGSRWMGGLNIEDDKEGLSILENYIDSKPLKPIKNKSNYLKGVEARHQVYLERFKSKLNKDFRGRLKEFERELTVILTSVDNDQMTQMTPRERSRVMKKLRLAQGNIYNKAEASLIAELKMLSDAEAEFETDAILQATSGIGTRKIAKSWGAAIKNPIQATGELLESFIKDMSKRSLSRVERQLRISISQGRTISQTVIAIRGTKKANYKDGVLNKNWNDARTVIRTATQHVSSQARQVVWEQNKDIINGYQWVSTLDGDTSPKCRTLDTEVFEVGQGPLPPIHPNCRSTTVPYFKDDIDLWDEDATRSAETGPVQVSTSYYQWLGKQPAAFQNDALGINRGKLLRNGGLSAKEFSELQLDKNFRPLTLDEMRQLKPNAFEKANI